MPSATPLPIFLLLALVAGLALAGCSGPRSAAIEPAASGFPYHSLDQIQTALADALPATIHSYRAETALSVRSPAQSGSFSANIVHRENDSLLISVSPGFGIVAVRALITPDSVFVHDRINRELTYGSILEVGQFLPLPTDPAGLYQAMLGLLAPELTIAWVLSNAGGLYILKTPDGRRSYTIDPAAWRVVRYEERNGEGGLLEERTFSEFERYTDGYLPRRLTFRRPEDDTAASLYYRKLTLNPPDLRFDFSVTGSVRRIPMH
ncbi:MAG: DUF4292 domain-containing protein [Rhodothermales bacterium]|nr:DUF4292 domain-containing protein [Rhodothermales bacterium]